MLKNSIISDMIEEDTRKKMQHTLMTIHVIQKLGYG